MNTICRIQQVQFEMLCEIDRICKKYSIKYFLCCGTLLGAIRHNGPIPWDDDLDVGLLREEYDKLVSVASKELDAKYFFQTWTTDRKYALPHCKIRYRFSHYVETVSKKSGCMDGISIDVLPFDKVPKSRILQIIHGFILFDILNLIKMKRDWSFIRENSVSCYRLTIYRAIINNLNEDSLIKLYDCIQQYFNKGKSKYVSETAGLDYFRFINKMEYYEVLIPWGYMDSRFFVPKEYNELLYKSYGDYLKLPPPEMRRGQPGVEEVVFNVE